VFEKHDVLPLSLYEFEVPAALYVKTLKQCEDINWNEVSKRSNKPEQGRSTSDFHREKECQDLKNFIEQCLEEVRVDIRAHTIEKIAVSQLWANKSVKDEWHWGHTHNWSFLTGIIYIKGVTGNTWFSRQSDYDKLISYSIRQSEEGENLLIHKQAPKLGSMFIFPSNLFHSVDEVKESERITISFNSFPTGTLGNWENLGGVKLNVE
jgi:uncharacterized protein (TIGR02466 family)